MTTEIQENTGAFRVPTKSNGNLLDTVNQTLVNNYKNPHKGLKYAFVCDWLTLNLEGVPNVEEINRLEFIPEETGTRNHKFRGDVVYNGLKVGILTFGTKQEIMDSKWCQFKLYNSLFYTMPSKQLHEIVDLVLLELGLKFVGVSRLDLALDFVGLDHNIELLLNAINTKLFRLSGRQKKITIHSETKNGVAEIEGASFGKRKSLKYARIYNKSKENDGQKLYINEFHKMHGLTGEIWRIEFQLSNGFFRDIEGVTLKSLFDMVYLFGVFEKAFDGYLDVRQNTGKTEVNKEKSIFWLNLDFIKKQMGYGVKKIQKLKRLIIPTKIGQMRMIKGLLRSYMSTYQTSEYIAPLRQIIEDFDLLGWFRQKLPDYMQEFHKAQLIRSFDIEQFNNDLKFAL